MFGRAFKFPIPKSLPSTCDNCGAKLHWQPVVYRDPYEYSVPGQAQDFHPQFAAEA